MKKDEGLIKVSMMVGPEFEKKLLSEMEDELDVASKKWGLSLNSEDREYVLQQSLKQLENKVSFITKNSWKISNNIIRISVFTPTPGEEKAVVLPTKNNDLDKIRLMRAHDHWRVENEETSESIKLNELTNHLLEEIVKWGRTAVFYGVGSYA